MDKGYIKTNEKVRTNVKGIYAAEEIKGSSPIGAVAAAYNGGNGSNFNRSWMVQLIIGSI